MRMSFAHCVILWLALLGQAVGMGLPGGGGVLCSKAGGQAQIEFALLECCGLTSGPVDVSNTGEEDSCSNTGCTDRLMDEAKPLVSRTKCLVDAAFGPDAPQVAPSLVDHQPRDVLWLNAVTAFKLPHEPTLVRAVIFLL